MKWKKYLIKFSIMIVISIIIIITKDIASKETAADIFNVLTDAFTVPGILFVCFGLLIMCANQGTFDMLSYGCQALFAVFKKDPTERKYRTFADYREAKAEKNKPFSSYIISGLIYIAIGIIMFIVYKLL